MKFLFCTIALFILSIASGYAQSDAPNLSFVNYETAKKAAVKWMKAKGHTRTVDDDRSYTNVDVIISDTPDVTIGEQVTVYVLNFIEGGFAIVPATSLVIPVLAYNHQYASERNLLKGGAEYFMRAYNEAITMHIIQNQAMEEAANQWENLMVNGIASCSGQSTLYPSLLEHYHTSRWASWDEVHNCVTPFQQQVAAFDATHVENTCVSVSMSQICKFYRHPFVGTGTENYSQYDPNISNYLNIGDDFSQYALNYDLMPYATGKQGPADGDPNDWSSYYPACSDERNEIGYLSWVTGVASRMNWPNVGTYGNSATWANDLVDHFGYTWNQTTDYVTKTSGEIPFKNAIRNSLMNEHPVLMTGFSNTGGHCFLFSGFECNNYFYSSHGLGGNSDGFYYLFLPDQNGNYMSMLYYNYVDAATNIRPLCNLPSYYQIPATTYPNGTIKVEQALIDLKVAGNGSAVTAQNGSELFFIGGNTVELLPGTEVLLGGKLHVLIENCNGPEGP